MDYNREKKRLSLPEYGRSVQNMVEHCKTIEDRETRNQCAQTIIRIMGGMFPERRTPEDNNKTLWDHLVIMAQFDLDVDYPVEVVEREVFDNPPQRIEYPEKDIIYRHYGRLTQKMIEKICEISDPATREKEALLLAHHMKRQYMTWNGENVDDFTIFKELYELSNGVLELRESDHKIVVSHLDKQTQSSKSKSKQRKKK